MNFYQFNDKLNGEPEVDPDPVDPPLKNTFWNFPFNTSGHELTPLTPDDMKTASREDGLDWLKKHGKNATKLGDPMTDDEFNKHHEL